MYVWNVSYEPADSDQARRWIGTVQADTLAEALQKAAELFEYPSHDLVVSRRG